MKKEYRDALYEVSEILKLMPITLVSKIPKDFCDMLEEEKSKDYFPIIKEPIEECELRKETIIILGIIYRDFLCSPEEKAELQRLEKEELKASMAINNSYEKVNYGELLKEINVTKTLQNNNVEVKEEKNLTVQEKKWYQKLFDLVKGVFKK